MLNGLAPEAFQVGAVTIAKIHLATGQKTEHLAAQLWTDYGRIINDEDAVKDWVTAANQIVAYLRDDIQHPHAVAVTHTAQFYCKNYDDSGEKRKQGIRGFFQILMSGSPPRRPEGDRVDILLKKFIHYQVALDAGLNVPEAPDDWSL